MSWTHEQVSLLIDNYKQHPCLYAVKNVAYKNRHARNSALEEIKKQVAIIRPETTIGDIKTKFCNLRTNFLAQYRKCVLSKKSGVGAEEVFTPGIWYYEQMSFILEHTIPRQSVDSVFPTRTNLQVSQQSTSKAMDQETDALLDDVDMENCETLTDSQSPDNNFLDEQIDFEHSQPKIIVHKVQTFHQDQEENYIIEPTQSTSSNAATVESTPKHKKIPSSGATKRKRWTKDKDENDDSVLTGATKALNSLTSAIVQQQTTPTRNTRSDQPSPPSERTSSRVFADYIADELSFLEKDEEIYVDTKQEICMIIFNARKTIIRKQNV